MTEEGRDERGLCRRCWNELKASPSKPKSWDYILEEWGWVLGGSAHGSVWQGGGYLAIKGAEPGVLSLMATGSTPGTATG